MRDAKKVVVVGWEKWLSMKECEKRKSIPERKDSGVQTDLVSDYQPLPPAKFIAEYFGHYIDNDDVNSDVEDFKGFTHSRDQAKSEAPQSCQAISREGKNPVVEYSGHIRDPKSKWLVLK